MISCVCSGEHTCTECLERIGLNKCHCIDCLDEEWLTHEPEHYPLGEEEE